MFPGLTAADFSCYEPQKWRSNVFNRERLEIKQKLLSLAREVGVALTASDGSPLFIEASVEHPALWNHKQVEAQHIYFSRNEAARKALDAIIDRQKPISTLLDDPTPQRNHVFLAISLSHEGLELSVKLHPEASVDRHNLERKLEEHYECLGFVDLLRSLSPGFQIGVTPDRTPIHAPDSTPVLDEPALRAIVHKLPTATSIGHPAPFLPPGQVPTVHMFYVGRAVPRAEILAMSPAAVEAFTRDGLAELLPVYRFIAWSRENDFVSMKQVLDKEKTVKRQKGLGKNDQIRIIRGVLAGKSGVVQEVDAKGQLRVLVGKMTFKIDAADVEKP